MGLPDAPQDLLSPLRPSTSRIPQHGIKRQLISRRKLLLGEATAVAEAPCVQATSECH